MMFKFHIGDEVIIHVGHELQVGKITNLGINDLGNVYDIKCNRVTLTEFPEELIGTNIQKAGISGVRSGKDETRANSMFDKESRDRIMKLMGNKEIRVMKGTEDLLKLLKDVKPIDTRGFQYFHYKLEDTKPLALTPSKVFFNDKKKATTIMFGETATVVKCGKGDKYDRRIGFLEAYFQATCNMSKNKALKYLNEIVKDKEVKEELTQEKKVEENKNVD